MKLRLLVNGNVKKSVLVFSWGAALNALRMATNISKSRVSLGANIPHSGPKLRREFASEWRSALAAQRFHAEHSTVVGWYIASDESLVGDPALLADVHKNIFDTTGRLVFGFAMAKTQSRLDVIRTISNPSNSA